MIRPSRSLCLALAIVLVPEALFLAADLRLVGSTLWRPMSWQYFGFWAGLLHGWRPNYAAQPVLMFATYALVHSGPLHAIGNAVVLAALGARVEERGGARLFWAILAVSVLAGAAAFGLLSHSPAPMVGISGGLFGLAGALAVWQARESPTRRWRMLAGGIAGLALINLASWWLAGGQMAWETHMGGALGGMAVAARFPRNMTPAACNG